MKQFYMITLLFAIFSTNAFGQEGWTKQTSPSSLGIMCVYAIDSLNIWAAGSEGLIIHTTDGGTTWDSIPSGVTVSLYTIEFINSDTGWVAGDDDDLVSTILRTTDGGASWGKQSLDGSNDYVPIWDVDFVEGAPGEPMQGYAAGGLGGVWRTNDYGETWGDLSGKCGESNFLSCYITDTITGWFVGTPSNTNPYTIMHTEDGGKTFGEQTNPTEIKLNGVCFGTDLKGIAVGLQGTIIYTSDGGTTWEASTDGGFTRWQSVFLAETGKAWAVGQDGKIIYSTDWGHTWTTQESGVPAGVELWEVYFLNDNEGWIVGGGIGQPGVILHTKNGGYSTPSMIDETLSKSITLFPNPVSDILTLESEIRLTKVEIYSIVGIKVKEVYTDFSTIQTGHLARGIYILKIFSENGFASKKFTKE